MICGKCNNQMTPCKTCKQADVLICLPCRNAAHQTFLSDVKIAQNKLSDVMKATIYRPENKNGHAY